MRHGVAQGGEHDSTAEVVVGAVDHMPRRRFGVGRAQADGRRADIRPVVVASRPGGVAGAEPEHRIGTVRINQAAVLGGAQVQPEFDDQGAIVGQRPFERRIRRR